MRSQSSTSSITNALTTKPTKRVPKGTSAYQATWIIDSASDDDYSSNDNEEDNEMIVDDDEHDLTKRSFPNSDDATERVDGDGHQGSEIYEDVELDTKTSL